MHTAHDWTGSEMPALGMGCWAIGGPFFWEDTPVGWGATDDDVSLETIRAAFDAGIRLFDTAQAYGTGHSESLLGKALSKRPEARIVTKIGIGIDPDRRQITGLITDPGAIEESLHASRRRLGRDVIDLVLIHPNEFTEDESAPIIDLLEREFDAGRIAAYGWSTDFPDKATAFAGRPGFAAVEHASNVFFAADKIRTALATTNALPLIRSPLAMGLLAGRITPETQMPKDDVRSRASDFSDWFTDGRMTPHWAERLAAVRESLQTGGRSLAQGAICWLWSRHPGSVPVPGMRTPEQVTDLVQALEHGPLPGAVMDEIETLLDRPDEGPPRPR